MGENVIRLPEIDHDYKYPLIKAIKKRRTSRSFNGEALTDKELSMLLWSCQGITDSVRGFRAAPSAGAIYPFTIYVVMERGFYKYLANEHNLTLHKEGDLREALTKRSLDQKAILFAGACLVLAYNPDRLEARYGERAFRYACMEAGHIAQNALLVTEALGLSAVAIGAYHDDFVKDMLGLSDDPLYMVAIGKK